MNKVVAILFSCVACGGAATPASVNVAPPPSATTTTAATPAPKKALALVPIFETHVQSTDLAIEGHRLFAADAKGELRVIDEHGYVAPGPPSTRRIAVGRFLYDPSSFANHTPALPKGRECDDVAYSADGLRMSAYCRETNGDAVYVYDTRNGGELPPLTEFQTAAPVRSGSITRSGNFVFWSSRASGAFEEIKTHVTGPAMSSISVMSADETMLFTTVDKRWYTDDASPARILDPKNARVIWTLDNDVDRATLSDTGGLFALHHSKRWLDQRYDKRDEAWFTVHASPTDFVRLDALEVFFARDGKTLAALFPSDLVRVYAIER